MLTGQDLNNLIVNVGLFEDFGLVQCLLWNDMILGDRVLFYGSMLVFQLARRFHEVIVQIYLVY